MPLQSDRVRFIIEVPRTKPSLSFSTGLFCTGLYNEAYTYTPTLKKGSKLDIDYYTITDENITPLTLGFNSLAHFTTQIGGLQTGVHLGFGIPIEKKLNVYGFYGISFPFGNKERIILNIGGVSGMANRLSNGTSTDQQFKDITKEIPLVRKLAHSWSISLTFNFYNK